MFIITSRTLLFQLTSFHSETGGGEDHSERGSDLRWQTDRGSLRNLGKLSGGQDRLEASWTGDRRTERVHHPEKQFHGQQAGSGFEQARRRQGINVQSGESQVPRRSTRTDQSPERRL